jgi:hypothetical protein
MSRGRKPKKKTSRKKLAYGVMAVVFILACFFVYSSLHSSPPKVAIVDHLSFFPEQRNQAFVNTCINILEEGGLTWTYHKGEEVTVNFYRNLPSRGTALIILRVHSAIMRTENETISVLGLFTSERYSDEAARKYRDDVLNDRLVMAFFPGEDEKYFGIVPEFVEKSMKGKFKDTIIIMMGCEGLGYDGVTYTDMAEAFIKKGAKVYISWEGPVSINHTDLATAHLLQSLILHGRTIKQAVTETREEIGPDATYNSELQYYPNIPEVENYIIPNLESSLIMNVSHTSPTAKTLTKPNTEHRGSARTL